MIIHLAGKWQCSNGILFLAWGFGIVHKEKRKKEGGNLVMVVAVIGGFGLVGGIDRHREVGGPRHF